MSLGLTTAVVPLWEAPMAGGVECSASVNPDRARIFVFEEQPGQIVGRPNLLSVGWLQPAVDEAQWLRWADFPVEV
ncbi:hypothetical protein [Streptomyces sp. CBMA156]|uniref:hypothetical protein n=1 Tax=Streptomyces sp. CBMA156 TaxID=1930280 RepID=UPI001661D48F|nr:hypothetical protein [Streptomyces sp. CBMA156]MBD0670038.1 hypothetical protein [Streptomyces sp. CBMA156]